MVGDEETKSASSFSSYDTTDSKGRFKCRACLKAFMSKKMLEKHRKTPEHKAREKKYAEDHAKQMEINRDEEVKFETTFKMACPECGTAFETEGQFKIHGKEAHEGIEFSECDDVVVQRSRIAWKMHFFPLFNAQEYANAAEGCKVACGVKLKTRDDIIAELMLRCWRHRVVFEKCRSPVPTSIKPKRPYPAAYR